MNSNAQKVYDYLMEGPKDFHMGNHKTCVLGAAKRAGCPSMLMNICTTYDASAWLGLSLEQTQMLCLDWEDENVTGPSAARERAGMLRAMCEANERGV